MENSNNKFHFDIKNKKYYILYSFIISLFLMFLYYLAGGMLGGKYIVMRSDLISGGIGGIKEACRDILNGDSIWFSYSVGLGMGNALYNASILFSPFNILYLIFNKVDENIVTAIIVILKAGCISASFCYYSKKILKNENFSSVIISVFYSLCAFVVAYGTINTIWLDSLMILPLLVCALINCIENDRRAWLIVLYSYLFISFFYFGYIVGVFSFIFVLLYLLIFYKNHSKKELFKKFFNWFLSGVISAMISAVVWVPTLFFMLANRVADSTGAFPLDATLLQVFNSLFWGNGYGIEGTYVYIYCGIPILFLVPLFFINKQISLKVKIFAGVLLGFYFACTIMTPLNIFMHMFDQPDSFWFRYSFIISFTLCSIACIQLSKMESINFKFVFIIFSTWALFYLIEQQGISLWAIEEGYLPSQNNNTRFIFNLLFMIAWIFIAFLVFSKNKKLLASILSICLISIEIITGSFAETSNKEESGEYKIWYSRMSNAVQQFENDKDLYRVICNNNVYINSDTWFGFNGFSDLGSEEKLSVRNFLTNMGFATSTRFIDDGGHTPVSEMLLGVKYIIKLPSVTVNFEDNDIPDDERVDINDNYLGFGYMVLGETGFFNFEDRNVFENMNSLVSSMTGNADKCFYEIPQSDIVFDAFDIEKIENNDGSGKLKRTDDIGRYYITVKNNNYDKVYFQLQTNDVGNYTYDYYILGIRNAGNVILNNAKLSTASELYFDEEKDKYNCYLFSSVDSSPASLEYDSFNIYALDADVLKNQYDTLSKDIYHIEKYSNGHIEGYVNNSGERNLLFLSIPYDPGWSVKVNGQEAEIVRLIDGAFMGVYLPGPGDYKVDFDYECPGLKIGLIVSICGIFAFLSVLFEKKLKISDKKANKKA